MNLMDKYINTKNNLQWSRQNPYLLHKISLHDVKVHVLYIPHVRKITGSVLYAEIIISESRRYCIGASKTAPYCTVVEANYSKEGGNRHKEKVATWHNNQTASLYYNKQNIYSVNACNDTQSR
jgi:hypothetical protein